MGDLVIMLVCGLLLPLTMLGLGLLILKTRPPFNDIMGYRTTWSQKNERLWNMGQELFGRYCTITYIVILVLSILCGVIPIALHMDRYTAGLINATMYLVQFVSVFAVIGVTDARLKRSYKKEEGRDD
ncbi:MAG: SdpI family protein [Oscillospiraceae bacterium]|nr:SdpI family protein [Oscillospiraceae bacterium]